MDNNLHDKIGVVEAMMLLQELHQQGYQKLRWYSYMAPNGLFLRCHITTEDNLQYNEDCVGIKNIKEDTWADSFGIPSTGNDVKSLVEEFKEELKCFIDKGKGEDPEYARWFDDLVEKAKEGKFPKYSEIYVDIPYHSIMVGKEFIKIPVTKKLTEEEIEIPAIPTFVKGMYQSNDDEKQIMMQSEDFYQYRKVFFKECAVSGVSFHIKYDDELWDALEVGTKLALVRHKDNKQDKNAVAIALADDYDGDPKDFDFDFIIGYVPRSENAELATLLDAGYGNRFSAEISTLKTHGNLNDRVRITIFLETNEKVLVRPDRLRAVSINEYELRKMMVQLNKTGYAYMRFGGYQCADNLERISPITGEKIVIVHRNENKEVLFLMMIVAEGDKCSAYTSEAINHKDNCSPYILTNIMGPIYIKKSDYNFLYGEDLKDYHAEYYLNKDVSDGFKEIFEKELFRTIKRNNIDMDSSIDDPNK
ncbi:MAG: HIRAN domain-containing protein [Muribaculaceae bacterium]|nr:HIRAN domain-containing protein [Muribaculaceae bacterium]